jgi:hypothetical protein
VGNEKKVEVVETIEPYKTEISFNGYQLTLPDKSVKVELGESNYDREQREKREAEEKAREEAKALYIANHGYVQTNPKVIGHSNAQCVIWARENSNVWVSGWARTNLPNSNEPKIGGVVVTKESVIGHVAVIVGIDESSIVIHEANYIHGAITERRLNKYDPRIVGYII